MRGKYYENVHNEEVKPKANWPHKGKACHQCEPTCDCVGGGFEWTFLSKFHIQIISRPCACACAPVGMSSVK